MAHNSERKTFKHSEVLIQSGESFDIRQRPVYTKGFTIGLYDLKRQKAYEESLQNQTVDLSDPKPSGELMPEPKDST